VGKGQDTPVLGRGARRSLPMNAAAVLDSFIVAAMGWGLLRVREDCGREWGAQRKFQTGCVKPRLGHVLT